MAPRRLFTGQVPRTNRWAGAGLCASARPLRRCPCEPRRPRCRAARRCPSTLTELSGSVFWWLRSSAEPPRNPVGIAVGPRVPAVPVSPRAVQRGSAPRSIPVLHCGRAPPAPLQGERSRPSRPLRAGGVPGADKAPCPPCSSARPGCCGGPSGLRPGCLAPPAAAEPAPSAWQLRGLVG